MIFLHDNYLNLRKTSYSETVAISECVLIFFEIWVGSLGEEGYLIPVGKITKKQSGVSAF